MNAMVFAAMSHDLLDDGKTHSAAHSLCRSAGPNRMSVPALLGRWTWTRRSGSCTRPSSSAANTTSWLAPTRPSKCGRRRRRFRNRRGLCPGKVKEAHHARDGEDHRVHCSPPCFCASSGATRGNCNPLGIVNHHVPALRHYKARGATNPPTHLPTGRCRRNRATNT